MAYDLIPINKKVKAISIGAFSWPIILQETGAGYIVGYGEGRQPASYVYQKRNETSPVSNDGFKVTAKEAKMMALIVRGYVSVKRFINKEWEEIPEPERQRQKDMKLIGYDKPIYNQGVHEDRLRQIEDFAEFAEQSKGFRIY